VSGEEKVCDTVLANLVAFLGVVNQNGIRHEWHCPRRLFVFSRDFFPLRAALKDAVYHASKIGILFASLKLSSLV